MISANAPDVCNVFHVLAQFLTQDDHGRCLRVCQQWHKALLPSLWANLELQDEDFATPPPLEALDKHRHLVERLTIYYNVPAEYYAVHFPNLQALEINELHRYCPTVLAQHWTLKELVLLGLDGGLKPDFWETVSTLPRLATLYVMNLNFDGTELYDFYKCCERLVSLTICTTHLFEPPRYINLGNLRTMELELVDGLSNEQQLNWLAQGTMLKRLYWCPWTGDSHENISVEALTHYASTYSWHNLQELVLCGARASDNQLSQIIAAMFSAAVLSMTDTEFGRLSMNALRNHFNTLRELNISNSQTQTGIWIPEILASCPLLENLAADRVPARSIMDGQPWACSGRLKKLRVFFDLSDDPLEAMQQQEDILDRLSELRCLVYLNVSHWSQGKPQRTLDFRLEKGLARLRTLKRLTEFRFYHTPQSMGIEEVEWMLYHWKRLMYITTTLCENRSGNQTLVSMLREGGVRS
ncbi:hypothetical protein BGZ65_011838 [Modicella reniformis]|uniref:F-box domain-containing protein n=1 Tax=Modicella reniformis TaxID=1440133 RepID=A0A9P6LTU1_9FUNG|nr:hypothetical protein BGZ65_011837 [Modicella reniformis]KAF9938951.1 hypothetical protein BGZ65_011838 [Modicella reniformis]